ncbi:hypothetical protein GIB67_022210 [Kingdonia uniflora]|uniref:Amine oxidase domain-containing protein n=1 Tax=Kingdonia uniflora TaxID=39325 RepID=A0A7J7M768_9MAGN|nr:hypothetical protein GIB67_022210 [Kingdonia uniflora]
MGYAVRSERGRHQIPLAIKVHHFCFELHKEVVRDVEAAIESEPAIPSRHLQLNFISHSLQLSSSWDALKERDSQIGARDNMHAQHVKDNLLSRVNILPEINFALVLANNLSRSLLIVSEQLQLQLHKTGETSRKGLTEDEYVICIYDMSKSSNTFEVSNWSKPPHRDQASCTSNFGRRQSLSPSVIVIGGGFAGIAATRTLHDASVKVVLLESRDRLGGRVCTDYSFGFPVDMGASWLHGVCKENPLAPLIGRLGLPLYRTSGDNSVLYDHDLESYALFDTDGNQVPQELVTNIGKVFESILEEADKIRQESVDDISILKAFSIVSERRPDLSMSLIVGKKGWLIRYCNGTCVVWKVGLLQMRIISPLNAGIRHVFFIFLEELLSGGHGLMVRGYLPVINTLAKGLDIRLSHRVTKIVRHHTGVKVTIEDGSTLVADAVIIAIPVGVLKSKLINFEPALPEWKEKAIADIGVGVENKIALHFDKVFWPNVEFLGVVAPTSYKCSYFLNLHKATGHSVLVYMPAGKLANEIEKLSDKDAADFAFMQLKKILPDASEPIRYLVSHWGTDIDSLGSYTYDTVGKPHDLYERLRIPVDNIFFAGEAMSINYPGTVHGAFSTGVLAAEDCRMRVLERYGERNFFNSVMGEETSVPLLISRM